jgi:integrase
LVGSFKGGFQRALKEAGVLFASDGKKRVPYSLRHTYATMRIAEG